MENKKEEEIMTITLKTLDGCELVLSSEKAREVAKQSMKIWQMLHKCEEEAEFPVGARVLNKAIDYCFEHGKAKKYTFGDFMDENELYLPQEHPEEYDANAAADESLREWDHEIFLKNCDRETILELVTAADHLWTTGLSDLVSQAAVDMMIGKSRKGIDEIFNAKYDFTPEELEESDKENESMLNKSVLKEPELDGLHDVIKFLGPLPFQVFTMY